MIVISDTTPLISLLKINQLDLLKSLFGEVLIPQAVYDELTTNRTFTDEAIQIKNCEFIKVSPVIKTESISELREESGLDVGESEAIILAEEMNADILLIDEVKGRSVAMKRNISITGTIGILIAAYEKEFVSQDDIRKFVVTLRESGRFISEDLFKELLGE